MRARAAEIARVVALALAEHDRAAVEPLPPRLRALEAQRLAELLATWLEVEATRSPFRVLAREERHRLDIEGLPVTVVVDRVDELGDGRLAIIDYKSGRADRTKPGPTRASPSRNCRSTPRWPFPIAPWPPSRWHA
jgi:RecB family exonuclease